MAAIAIVKKYGYLLFTLISYLQVCRDECETLEYDLCSQELAIARAQPMINHQLVLPVCAELPVVGSTLSYNCVRLGIPHVTKLIRPHGCYVADGQGYRGTVSVTQSGRRVAS